MADLCSRKAGTFAPNEPAAVAMADGYSQATGHPVLVNLHSAPGVASAMGAAAHRVGAAGTPLRLPDQPLLPPGTDLVLLTSDPDQDARAPVGDAVVGDVGMALRWLVAAVRRAATTAPRTSSTTC